MPEPERKQQPYTYKGLCEVITATLPENPPIEERAGFSIQWGGEFDGKERAFVVLNWGPDLMPARSEDRLMRDFKAALDARTEKDLDVVFHRMRDARPILIVQSK